MQRGQVEHHLDEIYDQDSSTSHRLRCCARAGQPPAADPLSRHFSRPKLLNLSNCQQARV